MSRSSLRASLAAGLLAVAGLLPAAGGHAQDRPAIQITPGEARAYRVAVQLFVDEASPPNPKRAADLRGALEDGLRLSGVLEPIADAAFLGEIRSSVPVGERRFDCADWTQSGADALVEGRILDRREEIAVEFAVWDTARCRQLALEVLQRPRNRGRLLSRLVADRIVGAFTGTPGSASTELAFISTRGESKEVYVMAADGGQARAATRSDSIKVFPSWLPDGGGILYTAYRDFQQPALYLTARSSRVRAGPVLSTLFPEAPKYRGVFAPDGESLALVTSTDGAAEIYWVERNGRVKRRLTDHGAIDISPSFSPDGRRLAFVSDRSGSPQLYVADLESGIVRRLTFQGSYNTSPAWSPDGRWIAYETRLEAQFDIWLIDPSGEISVPLVQHPRSDEGPSWSPDSRKLAFASNRRGRYDIYALDLASPEEARRLTEGEGENTNAAWGPFPPELRPRP